MVNRHKENSHYNLETDRVLKPHHSNNGIQTFADILSNSSVDSTLEIWLNRP